VNKTINYNYFHWGPFLYKTSLEQEELKKIKNLCSKESKDYRDNLAGLIRHEHVIDVKEMFPIIFPFINSYIEAYSTYAPKPMGKQIELKAAWVNYMTKFESNPLHTHDDDLSFVIYTEVPEGLKEEVKDTISNTKPGSINFMYTLGTEKYNVNQHTFMPQEGDFFIFPSSLHHSVYHFQSEGERVSVSGNLKITDG
jgi:uncharacterized protein (TIGR02466 family)